MSPPLPSRCSRSVALALACLIGGAAAAAEFEVPALRSAVNDRAGLLSPATRSQLETALRELQRQGGTQLAVLTLPNLSGLSIEAAAIRVADEWKLGTEQADNGVLLLVARDERRVRIEVGQGLEGLLTDAHAKRIIDEGISPLFRAGDMNGGITFGVYGIARRTNPKLDLRPYLEGQLRSPSRRGRSARASPLRTLFMVLLMGFVFTSRMGFLGIPFMMGGRRLRGGGLGGGGFGGFGGGGGGFSGGGASGGW